MSSFKSHDDFMKEMKKREEWRADNPFKAWLSDIPSYPRKLWRYYSDACDWFVYFIQRGFRGYADIDLWNWSYYNSKLQLKALKHLQKIAHGYPSNMTKGKHWRYQEAEWNIILDKIINAFELLEKEMNGDYFNFGKKCSEQKRKELEKKYPDWKIMTEKELQAIEEGLQLYIKYYRNLWD